MMPFTARRSTLLVFSLVVVALAAISVAHSQNRSLKELLNSTRFPSTIRADKLSSSWRVVRVGGTGMNLGTSTLLRRQMQLPSSPWDNLYFTQGETAELGGATYLVAYRVQPDPKAADPRVPPQPAPWTQDETVPETPKLPFDAVLTLSLLNLRESGSLHEIRAFNPRRDILSAADKARQEEEKAATVTMSNLKQLGLGLMQYTQDYDERLPPMRSARTEEEVRAPITNPARATVQQVVMPYIRNFEIFLHPKSRRPFKPNPILSGRSLASFTQRPSDIVAFYEDTPDKEGRRAVLFLDGHVERVDEARWKNLQKSSFIKS